MFSFINVTKLYILLNITGSMAKKLPEIESFMGKLLKFGQSTLLVSIPARHVSFSNLKPGDYVKVWYKKVQKEDDYHEEKKEGNTD